MWFLLLLHVAHIQPAVSQGGVKRLVLRSDGNPCEGHVEVFYKNEWGTVGDKFWNRSTEEVVCRSTHCGKPKEGSTKNVWRPEDKKVWLNELQCNGKEKQLWECDSPGWGLSYYPKPIVKKITCSRNITFKLEGPSRCAGAVRYFDGGTPEGYICSDNWNEEHATHLCEDLECGTSVKIPTAGQMSGDAFQKNGKNMKLDCGDLKGTNNLWQCAAPASSCQNPAAVICSGHTRLRLTEPCSGKLEKETNGKWEAVNDKNVSAEDSCQQMHCGSASGDVMDGNLTCTNNVKVVLVNDSNQEDCYGTVHVEVNGKRKAVCGSSWKKQAEVVCNELKCGTVNSVSTGRSGKTAIMDFVECSGSEKSLWHCEAKHGENLPCLSVPYVVCSASLEARLKDGGGRCAGRLEIKHGGQWKRVQNQPWTDQHSNIICKQLGCGNRAVPGSSEKYSDGSGSFLTVNCGSDINNKKNINECEVTEATSNNPSAVGITCEEHKVLFLSGSCSGEVGIKHGSQTFWLSNANWTESVANTVCQQMHCGNSTNAGYKPKANKEVWSKSYNCSGKETSLFECGNTTISQEVKQNALIASVTCSGKIQLKLTRDCWGNVDISMEGEQPGGICADTWTDPNSKKLCEELGDCGSKILTSTEQQGETNIMVLSLHAMPSATKLNQYNFIMKDKDGTCKKPASVVCSGSVKPRFSASRDTCSGNVELSYKDQWLPVCTGALNTNARNTICRALGCGEALEKTDDFVTTPASNPVITDIQCSSGAALLKDCDVTFKTQSCTLGVLKCSEWKTMVIAQDEPCKGEVVVYSEGKVSAVSREGWSTNERQKLCHDMSCGSPISENYKTPQQHSWPTDSFFSGSFNCTGKKQSIWGCQDKAQLSEKKEKLSIECKDETQVTLAKGCHGELKINNTQVCNSRWDPDYSNRVCQELSCSNAMNVAEEGKLRSEGTYHIHCDKYQYKLDQCRRVRGNCNSGKPVEIVCVGSIKFNTTETCGGKIQVSYRDEWKEMCIQNDLSLDMKNQLCQRMNCGKHNDKIKKRNFRPKQVEMKLVCTADHLDIRHCVKKETCEEGPAEIFCEGYKGPPPPPPPPSNLPLILGVSFLLVLLIVAAVGARFYFIRRNRKLNAARMLPGKEPEFESGEYEDVINGDNEIEDARGGRFRDDEFFREDDRRGSSPLPYDDIDEVAEAQPLNPPVNTARAGNMQEDQVTYEVEDPLENYDDIESGPEITKAEVHDGPQPTADRDAAAEPPGPAPGVEDYLVPGQEG